MPCKYEQLSDRKFDRTERGGVPGFLLVDRFEDRPRDERREREERHAAPSTRYRSVHYSLVTLSKVVLCTP